MTKFKVEMTFTDNASTLIEGLGYNVLYRETGGRTRIAGATWNGKDFEYHGGRFIQGGAPRFKKTDRTTRILGFYKLMDYKVRGPDAAL